jgi:hypothetical protein
MAIHSLRQKNPTKADVIAQPPARISTSLFIPLQTKNKARRLF